MARIFPLHPANPQRICWGCDKYCAADSLACSAERTPHLAELFGDDWADWAPGNPAGHQAKAVAVKVAVDEHQVPAFDQSR
jgi:hypothetical protein